MYDTIGLWFENENKENIYYTKEIFDKKTGEFNYSGRLRNFKIYTKYNKVCLNGSICKFVHNNNIKPLTFNETKKAVEEIADLLLIDPNSAKLSRIDIGINMFMEMPIFQYLNCLGELSRHEKWTIGNLSTVMFKSKLNEIVFYDKIKEFLKKGGTLLELENTKQILRYEIRYRGRMEKQLKQSGLTLKSLNDPNLCLTLIHKLEYYYNNINKVNNIITINDKIFDRKDSLYECLAAIGLESIGGSEKLISYLNNKKDIDSKKSGRFKNYIHRLNSIEEIIVPNEALKELNNKFNEQLKHLKDEFC